MNTNRTTIEKEIFSSWQQEDWVKAINALLAVNSIQENIKFSSIDNVDRIIELHTKLHATQVPTTLYVNALLSIFIESLLLYDVNLVREIITIVDNIKPSYKFSRFAQFAVGREFSEVLDFAPAGDFSNRTYFLNALIGIDQEGWFTGYFMDQSKAHQDIGFYQVAMRYFHFHSMKFSACHFLLNTEKYEVDRTAIELMRDAFFEYIFDTKKMDFLYEFIKFFCLKDDLYAYNRTERTTPTNARRLLYEISNYLLENIKDIPKYDYFVPVVTMLIPINNSLESMFKFKHLDYLIRINEHSKVYEDKYRLLTYACSTFHPLLDIEVEVLNEVLIIYINNSWCKITKRYSSSADFKGSQEWLEDCDKVAEAINLALVSHQNFSV